uniref:Uncharacterized protein n=1 Tax=Zea mays TaxID=4577 RepID=C4J1N4_MAIZE|nr:unknown [Zea mays]
MASDGPYPRMSMGSLARYLPPLLPLPLSTSGFSCPGLLSWKDVNGRNTS